MKQKKSGKRAAHFGSLQGEARSAGGTFDLRHEPRFGYKWLKRLAGLYYKIAVKNTENINANNGIRLQIAITKNLCFCLQIFALMLI